MSEEKEKYVRPPSAESLGRAPGRGRLKNRRVLVVGGGQRTFDAATDPIGNGRAISLLCARESARVTVMDVNLASAQETAMLAAKEGAAALAIEADVRNEQDVQRAVEQACAAMGGLDALVVNVGVGVGALGLSKTRVEDWDATFNVNLRGPMLCCRAALPVLEPGSAIVLMSSTAALMAGSRLVAYDSSKAGLGGLMRHVAAEGSRRGIRINTVCPGLVDTPLGRMASAGRPSRSATVLPFGRMATAWEVAYATLFLISDESVYVNAQTLAVDSGLSGI